MKPVGAWWPAWACSTDDEDINSPQRIVPANRLGAGLCSPLAGLRSFLGLLLLPLLEIGLAHHLHGGAHLIVAQSAQLGTRDLIYADLVGLEVEGNLHARHQILLQPQLRNKEVVDHITRMQQEVDVLVHRNFQGGADDVVLPGGIFVVDAQRIACGVVDVLQIGVAEFIVRSRVTERPGELLRGHFDYHRIRRSLVEVDARPDLRAHHHQTDEQQGRRTGPEGFELIIAVRISGSASVVPELHDDVSERELRQHKNDTHYDEGPHELSIVGDAVLGNGRRKPPRLRKEKIRDDYRQYPDYRSKQHPVLLYVVRSF